MGEWILPKKTLRRLKLAFRFWLKCASGQVTATYKVRLEQGYLKFIKKVHEEDVDF